MHTIVLSGFRPFGSYRENLSEIVVNELSGTTFAGYRIESTVFDATIPNGNRGEELLSIARRHQARGMVSLGIDSSKSGICIETIATNRISNAKYCPPHLEGSLIDEDRAYAAPLLMSLRPWNLKRFRIGCDEEDVPVTALSHDAGGFCCNHLMYQVTKAQMQRPKEERIPYLFLHLPCSPGAISDQRAHGQSGKITMDSHTAIRGLWHLLAATKL